MENIITEMENITMMLTGCDRMTANNVVNLILQAEREDNREDNE